MGHLAPVMRLSRLALCLWLLTGAMAPAAADDLAISQEQAKLLGIEVAPLDQQARTRGSIFPARVVIPPQQITVISAPLAARIASVDVYEDQPVSHGYVLARLDSPVLIRAQSEFLQALNQERFLRESLAREEALSSERIVSLKQMQATRNEHAQATATVAERRQMLRDYGMTDDAIEQLIATRAFDSKTVAVAQSDGVVIDVLVAAGQRVEAQAPLFKLARLDPLWLELQVPARQAIRFKAGLQIKVQGYAASGRVIAVGASADRTTQAVSIRAAIDDGRSGLKPGQFVEVLVDLPRNGKSIWQVRPEAIVRRGQDAFVFVKTDNGFRAQGVVVEEETPDATVISGPFEGNEHIAVRGLVALKGAWQGLGGSD